MEPEAHMTDKGPGGGTKPPTRYNYESLPVGENSVYSMQLELIGNAKRVLELGCAAGHMTEALVDHPAAVVDRSSMSPSKPSMKLAIPRFLRPLQ